MTRLRLFYRYVERYVDRRLPIWDRELNDLGFAKLGLQGLPTLWKIAYAVAVLSMITFLGLVVCFCTCIRMTARNLREKELIIKRR